MVTEGRIQKGAFEQRLEGGEGVDQASAQGKGTLSRTDSKIRGPGAWAVPGAGLDT